MQEQYNNLHTLHDFPYLQHRTQPCDMLSLNENRYFVGFGVGQFVERHAHKTPEDESRARVSDLMEFKVQ